MENVYGIGLTPFPGDEIVRQHPSNYSLAAILVLLLFGGVPAWAQQWSIDAGNSNVALLGEVVADDGCDWMVTADPGLRWGYPTAEAIRSRSYVASEDRRLPLARWSAGTSHQDRRSKP